MAYEIVFNKRFSNNFLKVLEYLEQEWGTKVRDEFIKTVYIKLYMQEANPFMGALAGTRKVRSIYVTKHNRLFYRVEGNNVVILNLFDTRSNKKM